MRRNTGYKLLTLTVVVALMAGCSESPRQEMSDSREVGEVQYDAELPNAADTVNLANGDNVGGGAVGAADSTAATSKKDPPPEEVAPGADSDIPKAYERTAVDPADEAAHGHTHAPGEKTGDNEKPKRNGRLPDGDDPEAPLIVPKVAEVKDDSPLNNGRSPTAKPIPEGRRVADKPKDDAAESFDNGRDKDAKPGAAPKVTDPATAKPAAPSQPTLADVSESIQELDKDDDGQLGLYEWPREKLAEFKTLDANQDGFLTPAELVAGQKKAADDAKKAADTAKPETDKPSKEDAKAADAKETDVDKPATKPDAESPPPADEKKPAAETTDEAKAVDTPADGAAKQDDPGAEDKPTQGS